MMAIDRLVIATGNSHKVREINAILKGSSIPIVGLEDYPGAPEVEETGDTLEVNAALKACSAADFTGLPAVADDTGLFIDALDGQPGVYSARFAGPQCNSQKNMEKVLHLLEDCPPEKRGARFECCVVLVLPGQHEKPQFFKGVLEGQIIEAPRGQFGFGYDPIFVPGGMDTTLAEISAQAKNNISHRARAFRLLAEFLETAGC
jgi:XTP/dITP diphosphohydrolase